MLDKIPFRKPNVSRRSVLGIFLGYYAAVGGKRYYVAIMAFLGFCNVYALRVDLSIAILDMTKNDTATDQGEFAKWSEMTKAAVLSAFFYGYILTQIPGGWLSAKYGGRLVFGAGILLTSISTLLCPVVVPWGAGWLIAMRVFQGLCQGVAYPSIHTLWSRWAPANERTKLATIGFSGSYFGTVIAQPLSGLLADRLGWRAIFIFFGLVGILWSLVWLFTVADDPSKDKHISDDELKMIQDNVGFTQEQAATLKPPWLDILKSPPVWALTVAHFAENWGFYTMLTQLPRFIQHLDKSFHLQKASILAAIPYLLMGIMVQLGGWIADYLRTYKQIETVKVRKAFNCGAFLVQALFIIGTAYTRTPISTLFCVTLAVGFGGFAWSGFSVNPLDIAPAYAGVVMGLSNTVATIPGLISPEVTASLVDENKRVPSQWEGVWWLCAGVYIFGAVVYAALASGTKQNWAIVPEGYATHVDEEEEVKEEMD